MDIPCHDSDEAEGWDDWRAQSLFLRAIVVDCFGMRCFTGGERRVWCFGGWLFVIWDGQRLGRWCPRGSPLVEDSHGGDEGVICGEVQRLLAALCVEDANGCLRLYGSVLDWLETLHVNGGPFCFYDADNLSFQHLHLRPSYKSSVEIKGLHSQME